MRIVAPINIDLQNDPEIPAGRAMLEHLVGAHMSAQAEDELLHLVRHSMEELLTSDTEHSIRVLTHAVYRGQSLIVKLLDLATAQSLALGEAGIDIDETIQYRDPDRFRYERLSLWHAAADDAPR